MRAFNKGLALGLLASLGVTGVPIKRADSTVCDTPACKTIAETILNSLAPNHTAYDPCTPFDRMVCDGWDSRHELKATQTSLSVLDLRRVENMQIMETYVQGEYPGGDSEAEKSVFNLVHDMYRSCVDEKRLNEVGLEPLIEVIGEIKRLWPISNGTNRSEEQTSLTEVLLYMAQELAVEPFVRSEASPGDNDQSQIIFPMLMPPKTFFSSGTSFENTETLTGYTSDVSSMLQMVSNSSMDHGRLVEKIVAFERQVTTLGDSTFNSDRITEKFNNLAGYGQQIALDKYLQAQFPANYQPDDVLLRSSSYFKRVSELIEKTDRETVQGYLIWFTIYTLMSRVAPDFSLPLKRLRNVMIGLKPENGLERWKSCMNQLATDMRWSYGRGFLQQAFPAESKTLGDRMIQDFKNAHKERVREKDWMSDAVKERAIAKVDAMVQKIGYPTSNPDLGDAKSVSDWYHGLNISSDTYFKNSVDLAVLLREKNWPTLLAPKDINAWMLMIADMNAYHAYDQKAIIFPAGFMQSPLFGLSYPDYINYGAWGMLAGHEIIHGFDNLGHHFDETGAQVDWWDNATSVEFEQRGQCFVDQFDQYQIVGADGQLKNVNGTRSQNEAIADAGGLATSFRAWQKREAQAPSKKLPGLEGFTAEQLFFISFGHIWCSKMQPARLEKILDDSHPPHRARLLYTAANSRGFLEAFNCPTKEPVCELW